MPINLTFKDERLEGLTPASTAGSIALTVDGDRPLSWFFDQCQRYSRANGGISALNIMAHGLETPDHAGGYGILFCREGINPGTVGRAGDEAAGIAPSGFGLIRGMVERIVLYVCAPAAYSPAITLADRSTLSGHGFETCRQMAINARASVIASSEVQAYTYMGSFPQTFGSPDDPLGYCVLTDPEMEFIEVDFGGWEGRVYTFDENGNYTEEVFPSIVRDSMGVVHDPREFSSPAPDSIVRESWYCPILRDSRTD